MTLVDENLPVISTDQDWFDLRIGESAKLPGKLHSTLHPGAISILITNAAWNTFAVFLPDGYSGEMLAEQTSVTIVIERIEDGMSSISQHIYRDP